MADQAQDKQQLQYNRSLFESGLRRRLHLARFLWLSKKIRDFTPEASRFFELGCFDAKTIEFIPGHITRYVGIDLQSDAIAAAKQAYLDREKFGFYVANHPSDVSFLGTERFDAAFSMETLEHIDDDRLLDDYIDFICQITLGPVFITVPYEKGILFLAKHLAKRGIPKLRGRYTESYSLSDVFWHSVARPSKVERLEHKGFDHLVLLERLRRRLDIIKVESVFSPYCPLALSFTVGIVAQPKSS